MREAFSYFVSAALHAGAYGLFIVCAPQLDQYFDASMTRGKPVALVMVMPAMASQVEEELPPIEIEQPPEETRPVEVAPQETKVDRPPQEDATAQPPLVEVSEVVAAPPSPQPRERTEEQPPPEMQATVEPIRKAETRPQMTVSSAAIPFQASSDLGLDVEELPQQLATNRPPVYPPSALAARLQGRVVVIVKVRADGTVAAASVYTSSGNVDFDASATNAVGRWKFKPAVRGGKAVEFEILAPVNFVLRD